MAAQKFGTLGSIQVRRGDVVRITDATGTRIGVVHGWQPGMLNISGAVRVSFDGIGAEWFYPQARIEATVIGRARYHAQRSNACSTSVSFPSLRS